MSDANLVYGIHAVEAVLRNPSTRVVQVWIQSARTDARIDTLLQLAEARAANVQRLSVREMDQRTGNAQHQGAIAELAASSALGEGALDEILDRAGAAPLVLILDGVQDPHNLGACLRTADAAGVSCVVVPRDRAAGISATVRKVASGAADSIPLIQVVNLSRTLKWLKNRGLWLVGTDTAATTNLHEAELKGPLAVVLGAEGTGMRRLTREHCDLLIAIPMAGVVESLNVSVATGVVLYEALRQRRAR